MNVFLQIIGTLLVVFGVGIISITLCRKSVTKGRWAGVITLAVICFFFGYAFIFPERTIELSNRYVGTLKASAQVATSGAKEIGDLKTRIENQSATIDLVASRASDALKLSEDAKKLTDDLSKKNESADAKLKTLDASISEVTQNIATLTTSAKTAKDDLKLLHDQLSKAETTLSQLYDLQQLLKLQVHLQDLGVSAKNDSYASYLELEKVANSNSDGATVAQLILNDVDYYFNRDRYDFVQMSIQDAINHQPLELSVDDAIEMLNSEQIGNREAAINRLDSLAKKSSVGPLIQHLSTEDNSRVISRITKALENITKEKFSPLSKEAVSVWWNNNKANPEFNFSSEAYNRGQLFLTVVSTGTAANYSVIINPDLASLAIPYLQQVIKFEPAADKSRFSLVLAFIGLKKLPEAESELAEFEKENPNYSYLPVAQAALKMAQGKTDDAVDFINAAFSKSPANNLNIIRHFELFKSIADDKRINWPATPAKAQP